MYKGFVISIIKSQLYKILASGTHTIAYPSEVYGPTGPETSQDWFDNSSISNIKFLFVK